MECFRPILHRGVLITFSLSKRKYQTQAMTIEYRQITPGEFRKFGVAIEQVVVSYDQFLAAILDANQFRAVLLPRRLPSQPNDWRVATLIQRV